MYVEKEWHSRHTAVCYDTLKLKYLITAAYFLSTA